MDKVVMEKQDLHILEISIIRLKHDLKAEIEKSGINYKKGKKYIDLKNEFDQKLDALKELNFSKLKLEFNETPITFKEYDEGDVKRKPIREGIKDYFNKTPKGKCVSSVHPKGMYFGTYKQHPDKVSNTCIADSGGGIMLHSELAGYLTDNEYKIIGTYPLDYNFKNIEPKYLIGMSVPPVMIAQIANQIKIQWLDKIYKEFLLKAAI